MDGTMSAGRKPAEREGTVPRTSVSLPSTYLEELDTCSSPGAVSKKAAYFEEVIRSASTEKRSASSGVKEAYSRSLGKVHEEELASWNDSVKALNFSSDSEGNNEIENRPPEVNRQVEDDAPGLLAKQGDETVVPAEYGHATTEETKLDDTSCTLVAEVGSFNEGPEDESACTCFISEDRGSLGDINMDGDMTNDDTSTGPSEHIKGGSIEERQVDGTESLQPHADTAADDAVVSDEHGKAGKVNKDPDRKATMTVARDRKKDATKASTPGKRNPPVRSSTTTTAFLRHTTREAVRHSTSEVGPVARSSPVSRSTSFMNQSLAAKLDNKRPALRTEMLKPNAKLPQAAPSSSKPQLTSRAATKGNDSGTKNSSPSSDSSTKTAIRRSVSEFQLESEIRAEKRKEYYMKREERMAAKELEKNLLQAKSQEDTEAELQKLRQSLTFKAKPMPSFYHESPQPKRDLRKKVPTTRAISPKLGRPKSKTTEEQNSNRHHHVRPCQQLATAIPQDKSPRSGKRSTDTFSRTKATTNGETMKPRVAVEETEAIRMQEDEDCSILDFKDEDEELSLL